MSPRAPLAPVVAGGEDLPEVERVVLDALRRRRRQFEAGMPGVGSPALVRRELLRRLHSYSVLGPDERPRFPLAGIGDRRVRRAIEALREQGHPICSSPSVAGYWLSDDAAEVRDCAEHLRAKPAVLWALRRAAAAIDARKQDGAATSPQGGLL